MVKFFYLSSLIVYGILFGLGFHWRLFWVIGVLLLPVFVVGVIDSLQTRQAVRRNFPIIGNLRYFFEFIRPELQQYFVEDNHDGRPVPREFRSVVYQRAKGQLDTLPFGTQRDIHAENYEWIHHTIKPIDVHYEDMRTEVGGPQCQQKYSSSIFNISAMSYGALSKNAISALNLGAKNGNFFHNTGEGGISPYHRLGGDLVWQIGTGYFGARDENGFSETKFQENASLAEVKMIELKISQGAKPGKGGILPAEKVSKEVAEIRGVTAFKTVVSPSYHSEFSTPIELLEFIQKLRDLSGGKPVGFKLCIGRRSEFYGICKAMVKTQIYPDFITVDGAEGGTGAAPLEFANSVGRPLDESLAFVIDSLNGFNVRDKISVIASGKVFTSFHLLTKIALGADIINSSRAMMMALGCIQALKCNTNQCPVGVATTDPALNRGLVVANKHIRVTNYHQKTVKAFADMLGAMGYKNPDRLNRGHVFRRLSNGVVKSYEEIYPEVEVGSLLNENDLPPMPEPLLAAYRMGRAEAFYT